MEKRHRDCHGTSSDKPIRNISKKCYSLPALQRENEKLKNDLNVLEVAHDEKESLLSESLLKVQLLQEENHELKGLLRAAVPNKAKVIMKDASTCQKIDTKNQSTSVAFKTQVEMKDACTCVKVIVKNVSTSTSVINVDNGTQVEMNDSTLCEPVEAENWSSSSSDVDVDIEIKGKDEAKNRIFDETVSDFPYEEKTKFQKYEEILKDRNLSLNMKEHFQKIGGSTISKVVNNILNEIATKNLLKQFVWDAAASNSFQKFTNILSCIYSAVCSKDNTKMVVNNIVKNALKNARAKP